MLQFDAKLSWENAAVVSIWRLAAFSFKRRCARRGRGGNLRQRYGCTRQRARAWVWCAVCNEGCVTRRVALGGSSTLCCAAAVKSGARKCAPAHRGAFCTRRCRTALPTFVVPGTACGPQRGCVVRRTVAHCACVERPRGRGHSASCAVHRWHNAPAGHGGVGERVERAPSTSSFQ